MSIYLLLVTIIGLATVTVRYRMIGGRIRGDVPAVQPYATAYLAGGPSRVALVAIADMVEAGQLLVDGKRLRRMPVDADFIDPVTAAVLRGFGGHHLVRASHVLKLAIRQPELREFEDSLRGQGFLADPTQWLRTALLPAPLAIGALLYPVLLFRSEWHAGLLGVVLVPVAVAVFVLAVRMIVQTPRTTPLGHEMVYRAAHPVGGTQNRLGVIGVADPVVVDGFSYSAEEYVFAATGVVRTKNPELSYALYGPGD